MAAIKKLEETTVIVQDKTEDLKDLNTQIDELQDELSETKEMAASEKDALTKQIAKLIEERNKLAASAQDNKEEEEEPEESSSFFTWFIAIVAFIVIGIVGFFHLTKEKPDAQKEKTPENGDSNHSPALF